MSGDDAISSAAFRHGMGNFVKGKSTSGVVPGCIGTADKTPATHLAGNALPRNIATNRRDREVLLCASKSTHLYSVSACLSQQAFTCACHAGLAAIPWVPRPDGAPMAPYPRLYIDARRIQAMLAVNSL